jgi:carboxyl-terminal processing protease
MWEDDEGEYAGIGIQISASYETMLCTISRVFSNSPAADVGLRRGDILYKVEDLDVDASTLTEAVGIMRGTVGEPVHVQVLRNGELLDFDIPRAVVHVNWVSSCMLDNDVGYILLYEFSGDCADTFHTQLNALVDQGAKALIVDLRDNPGGWIEDAVNLADIFLPEEMVTYLEYRDGSRDYYNATEGSLSIPLVVMMNENSASASEILAGALQDYAVATIVGTQSYGKGIVQCVLPVGSDGAGMQLTTALYYTPGGRSIHKVGITPDVEAAMPESDTNLYELGDLNDAQLQAAYEVALESRAGTFPVARPLPPGP